MVASVGGVGSSSEGHSPRQDVCCDSQLPSCTTALCPTCSDICNELHCQRQNYAHCQAHGQRCEGIIVPSWAVMKDFIQHVYPCKLAWALAFKSIEKLKAQFDTVLTELQASGPGAPVTAAADEQLGEDLDEMDVQDQAATASGSKGHFADTRYVALHRVSNIAL